MLRQLDLGEHATPRWAAAPGTTRPPAGAQLSWIDLTAPSDDELDRVAELFRFHALALDDCKRLDQRPKLEPYEDHLFVVMHRLACTIDPPLAQGFELHGFIGANYLVTVHAEPLPEIDQVLERLEREPEVMRQGPDFWYYLVADRIVLSNYAVIERLAEAVEDTEEEILQGKQQKVVDHIFALKRLLATARRLVSPERELFASLAKWGAPLVRERTALYFRAIHDDLARAVENIESYRELLNNALDAHFSHVSQRTNDVVKHLTLLSSIFLPLAFVTGFFGMNFEHLPFGSGAFMWGGIAACILLPVAMLLWFRANRWL